MKLNQKLETVETRLGSLEGQQFDHLDFEWEGIRFSATSDANSNGPSTIEIKATLGRLYFTIEDSLKRSTALDQLFSINRQIDGVYNIGPKGDIFFKSSTNTDSHLCGNKLINALTLIILEAESHLRALRMNLK